ncbi:MAG: hypothetical protein HYZ28_17180 [Myxococcales bacterium]|nr:hypothetical protein [Myxococcales bacterium]
MALAALAALVACGPRQPGPRPGEVLFWRVTSSEVSFVECTDDPGFRDQLKPVAIDENTYLIYRVEKDGRRATALSCESFSAASCSDHPSGIVYEVAGNELFYSRETKDPIGTGGCMLQDAQSWVLTDKGVTLEMVASHVLGLVDSPTDCESLEAQVKRQSPNGLGVQGCIVRFTLGAMLR